MADARRSFVSVRHATMHPCCIPTSRVPDSLGLSRRIGSCSASSGCGGEGLRTVVDLTGEEAEGVEADGERKPAPPRARARRVWLVA